MFVGVLTTLALATASFAENTDSPFEAFFDHWSARVQQARETQPEWVPPLMTLSPLITELVRWDAYYENLGRSAHLLDLGANKGVFLVPDESTEIDIGLPSYQKRYGPAPASGLADYQFLLIKQRLLSANATEGDYILTAALAAQAPIGATRFTNSTYVITPTLTGGKGFGNLNFQAATGLALPTSNRDTLGSTWSTNATAQYRLARIFWPELEVNWTRWLGGSQRRGVDQVFVTVGMIAAPLPITRDLKLVLGAGFQFAVAPAQTYFPAQAPVYRNNVIFTARVLF